MLNNLIKLSNHLDSKGLQKEADYLDSIISKVAQMEDDEDFDFFDEEESEESGPLQIDLGPDAVEKVEIGSREPVVEKYSLEAKGFDKKKAILQNMNLVVIHRMKYTLQQNLLL